jgi:hypothetical protein
MVDHSNYALGTVSINGTLCSEGVDGGDWYEYDCYGTIGTEVKFEAIGSKQIIFCGVELYGVNSFTSSTNVTSSIFDGTELSALKIKTDDLISNTEYYLTGHTASEVIIDYIKFELEVKACDKSTKLDS